MGRAGVGRVGFVLMTPGCVLCRWKSSVRAPIDHALLQIGQVSPTWSRRQRPSITEREDVQRLLRRIGLFLMTRVAGYQRQRMGERRPDCVEALGDGGRTPGQ